MANVINSFTAAGQSASFRPNVCARSTNSGAFNIVLTGSGVGSIQLERSFDDGTTWCPIYAGGTQLYQWSYAGSNLSETAEEIEAAVIYRLNCTAWTSGAIAYRLSR